MRAKIEGTNNVSLTHILHESNEAMVSEILENGAGHRDPVRSSRKVVLKFGGTSIGKFAPAVAEICLSSLAEYPIAVVCSARSGRSKAEGTTNLCAFT